MSFLTIFGFPYRLYCFTQDDPSLPPVECNQSMATVQDPTLLPRSRTKLSHGSRRQHIMMRPSARKFDTRTGPWSAGHRCCLGRTACSVPQEAEPTGWGVRKGAYYSREWVCVSSFCADHRCSLHGVPRYLLCC